MASPDHAATIRRHAYHVWPAAMQLPSEQHDPACPGCTALDALVAALAQAERERDEARKHANKLGRELDEQGDELERECDYCDGRGWYGEPDHGPDCTPDKCGAPCPVERQVPCPSCAGTGALGRASREGDTT